MAENIIARDLMLADFASIRSDQTLGEALHALIELQSREQTPNALVVLEKDSIYEGLLTARLVAKSLLALWMPEKAVREDELRLEKELLDVVQDRLHLKVHDALIRGLPTVAPDDRLLRLIEIGCEKRLEFVPVLDDGHVLGLVPVTAIFQAAAGLALTPEDEGIRFEQK